MDFSILVSGLDFLRSNTDGILSVIAAVHALALAIVNLTPSPKDNEEVEKWYRYVEYAAGLIHPRAKD